MDTVINSGLNTLKYMDIILKIRCFIFGHNLILHNVEELEIACSRCGLLKWKKNN